MTAVDNILAGQRDKSNIWAVNTEGEYHEEKTSTEDERLVRTAAVGEKQAG
jgi:hypothetical protein